MAAQVEYLRQTSVRDISVWNKDARDFYNELKLETPHTFDMPGRKLIYDELKKSVS